MTILPEIREDFILGYKVIMSPLRATRPKDIIKNIVVKKVYKKRRYDKKCPFCIGNEYMLPGIVNEKIDKKKRLWIRTVKNKYFATSPFAKAYGYHEVIVETPNHNIEFHELSKEQIKTIIDEYCNRIIELNKDKKIKYVDVFKNRGVEGGASLMHSHSQVVALNVVPDLIKEYIKVYKKNCNKMLEYIQKEKKVRKRIVYCSKNFTLLCPYASRFHYELWFIPNKKRKNITKLSEDEKKDLSILLKKYIKKLFRLGNVSYNLMIINAPLKYKGNFHFFIVLAPRMAKFAGFEFSTGITINSQPPEYSAEFYRI